MRSLLNRFKRPASDAPTNTDVHLLLQLGNAIAQTLFARDDLDTLLHKIAQTVTRLYGPVEIAQIFLLDEARERAALRASTSPTGQQWMAQEYEEAVGGLTLVGRATRLATHQLVHDFKTETVHQPLPPLTRTRTQLVIPFVAGDDVIGALDLHSQQPHAFSSATVENLLAAANQIAVAVDSLQLYETAQRNMRENKALYVQTQASLREIERLNYQLTGRAWSDYLHTGQHASALELDSATGQGTTEASWTPTLIQAVRTNTLVRHNDHEHLVVALPIVVRNQVIGAMEFELPPGSSLSSSAQDTIKAVGERLGLALENRRLLDETERVAQREALINDIGAELQAATGVDAILQRAARQLHETLAAHQVTISLGDENLTAPPDRTDQQENTPV